MTSNGEIAALAKLGVHNFDAGKVPTYITVEKFNATVKELVDNMNAQQKTIAELVAVVNGLARGFEDVPADKELDQE